MAGWFHRGTSPPSRGLQVYRALLDVPKEPFALAAHEIAAHRKRADTHAGNGLQAHAIRWDIWHFGILIETDGMTLLPR